VILTAVALSLAAHAVMLGAILLGQSPRAVDAGLEPVSAILVKAARLEPAPADGPAPPPPSRARRPPQMPPDIQTLPADPAPIVTEAQLVGAATADTGGDGTGSGDGGACNMPRRLQDALRQDRLVQAAVAGARKPIMVWNGDWLRRTGEDGKGLAAVREAIMWGVAFAPANCREAPVHGLVLLSLNDGARLVVGGGDWRWSDLLALHREG
jgi:hypothetical protein